MPSNNIMVLHIYKAEENKLDFKKVANELIQETLKKVSLKCFSKAICSIANHSLGKQVKFEVTGALKRGSRWH